MLIAAHSTHPMSQSKTQHLRTLIIERLSAAVDEIFGDIERTIAEYEEEVRRSHNENARQRKLLDGLFNSSIKLHRTDHLSFTLSEEEVPPDPHYCEQGRSPSLDREEPDPPSIKEEGEELWSSQEGGQLQKLNGEETDAKTSVLIIACVESLSGQNQSQSSHLDPSQSVDSREGDPVATTSTDPDGEDSGKPEPEPEPASCITGSKDNEWYDAKPLSCVVCGKTFNQKSSLTAHKRTHKGMKSFRCNICIKEFKSSRNLEIHMRNHTGEAPYHCSVCGKRFKINHHLTVHMRSHTGEKPYKCSLCSKAFKRKDSLDYHLWTHTGEKHYSCTFCEKGFYQKCHLTAHMRVHTGERPYKCSICPKEFTQRRTLNNHMSDHTGKTRFQCSICSKGFNCKSAMKVHTMIHAGFKPSSESVCGLGFKGSPRPTQEA